MKFLDFFEEQIKKNYKIKKEIKNLIEDFENVEKDVDTQQIIEENVEKPIEENYFLNDNKIKEIEENLKKFNEKVESSEVENYFLNDNKIKDFETHVDTQQTIEKVEENVEKPIEEVENYFLKNDEENTFKVPLETEPKDFFLDEKFNPQDKKELQKDLENVDIKELETDEQAQKTFEKMIEMISGQSYKDTVDFLDEIAKDVKLKFLLSLGFGGKFADLKLKLKKTNIPALRLIPTQNEIGLDETLKYLMKGEHIDDCFGKSVIIKKPIVTFQGTFIIDGHHRWSEIYATNPNANLECVDISGNLSPITMLKTVQATIASNLGKLIIKDVQGKNLFDCSEKDLKYYLKDTPKETIEKLSKYYEKPIDDIVENCLTLKVNNAPILNAPKRGDMPQTSKDPELFSDLKNGVTKI